MAKLLAKKKIKSIKPEWKELAEGLYWCRGCGCVKIEHKDKDKATRYLTPRRERERRIKSKGVRNVN